MLVHEGIEIGFDAVRTLIEHLVEVRHHVLHGSEILGGHVRHCIGHAINGLLHKLISQVAD